MKELNQKAVQQNKTVKWSDWVRLLGNVWCEWFIYSIYSPRR